MSIIIALVAVSGYSVVAFGRSNPGAASPGSSNFQPPRARRTPPRSKRDKVPHNNDKHRRSGRRHDVQSVYVTSVESARTTSTSDTSLLSSRSSSAEDSCGDDVAFRDGGDDTSTSLEAQLEISTQDMQGSAKQKVSSSKKVLVGSLLGLSTVASGCAYTGIIPGYIDEGMVSTTMILRDVGAAWTCAALAYTLVKINTYCFENEIYGPTIARKVIHLLSVPAFMLFFPIFTAAEGAKYFASVVSLTNLIQLWLSGNNMGDPSLAKAVSRSGDTSEALAGPLIYVSILQICILCFWRTSPIGIVALSTMAAGDGMADLIGRKFGRNNKWWFSDSKSIAGTAAFAVFSAATSFGLIQWLMATDCLTLSSSLTTMDVLLRVIGISVASSLIELVPIGDDNITVPLTAGILTALLLQ